MMKKRLLIALIIALSICCILHAQAENGDFGVLPSEFFAQMDSYMYVQQQSEHPISFYVIYHGKTPFDGRTLYRLYLTGNKSIDFYEVKLQESGGFPDMGYAATSIMCQARFNEVGHYEFDSITLLFGDGSSETYPIGRFVIDVSDEAGSDALDTYATVAMNTLEDAFHGQYTIEGETAVDGIEVSLDLYAKSQIKVEKTEEGFKVENQMTSDRPAVYRFIVPHLEAVCGEEKQTVYVNVGCICGGAGITFEKMVNAYWAWNAE